MTNEMLKAVDASDLGWGPGQIERAFVFEGYTYKYARTEKDPEGDVTTWIFVGVGGRVLYVHND